MASRPHQKTGCPPAQWQWWAWVGVWVVAMVAVAVPVSAYQGVYSGIPGDFCRSRRPTQCCDNRVDECSAPILGTLCYCDMFCNRTYNPDCCPDFWEVCHGITPVAPPPLTKACQHEGEVIPGGQSRRFNCNECKCSLEGRLECEEDECMVDVEQMNIINQRPREYGWRANNFSDYWGRKLDDGFVLRTGTLNPETLALRMYPILLRPDRSLIPSQFDARQRPEWTGRVSGVSDQGWCGASWAFSTLGVAQDRLSIESFGNETVRLAPQHLISCDRRGQKGCEGGHVDRAWQYLRKIGVVNEECYQYESGTTGKVPNCRIPRRANLFNLRCAARQYQRSDLYKTEPAYRIDGTEEDIQWEIMNNGPVQAMMRVYRDFFMYASGVYHHSGSPLDESASHSVRIIGWGVDSSLGGRPTKYWLVANSWGDRWGERGFFRIRRGTSESGIETFILAVRARLADYERQRGQARGQSAQGQRRGRHTHHRNHHSSHKGWMT